jgi:hypothetical protein
MLIVIVVTPDDLSSMLIVIVVTADVYSYKSQKVAELQEGYYL